MKTHRTLSVADVAERYAISGAAVRRLILNRSLNAVDVSSGGKNRVWRISEADLRAFEAARSATAAPKQTAKRKAAAGRDWFSES